MQFSRYRHFLMVVRIGMKFKFIQVDRMVVKMDMAACRRGGYILT